MSGCFKLKCLPFGIEMESLETLKLSHCRSLERLPELSPCMVKLSHISLDYCRGIEELPSSIKYLSNLSFLNLNGCSNLENIPKSICYLKCLKTVDLHDCWKLQKLPNEFGRLEKLEELHFLLTDSLSFHALSNLGSLRKLNLNWSQIGDHDFPKNLHGLSSLEELRLSGIIKLIQLPASISHLSRLKRLDLNDCYQLQNLQGLPSRIQVLQASRCSALEKIDDLVKEHQWLYNIRLFGCQKLLQHQENQRYLNNMLEHSFLKKCVAVDHSLNIGIPGSTIPSWFKEQQNGGRIALKLPPKWETEITGFAICGVFPNVREYDHPCIKFRFENDGMFVLEFEADNKNNASSSTRNEDTYMWNCYVPFSLFKQMHDNDDEDGNDFQREDWSRFIEGTVVVEVSSFGDKTVRCAAQVVYKQDVESIQQVTHTSISSYYWKWKLEKRWAQNTFLCSGCL